MEKINELVEELENHLKKYTLWTIRTRCFFDAFKQSLQAEMKNYINLDSKIIEIDGIRYARAVFKNLSILPLNTCCKLIDRKDGVIAIENMECNNIPKSRIEERIKKLCRATEGDCEKGCNSPTMCENQFEVIELKSLLEGK